MTQTDKIFYKTAFAITLPIALQNIISYSVNLMDTVMLGKLGEIPLSAASLANQMFFIFTIACYGIGGGAMVLSSQYWGKQEIPAIQKITTISVKIAFLFSTLFFLCAFLFPKTIMGIFIGEASVIEAGASYLRVVSISYLFFGLTSTLLVILRSVETVHITVLIYIISFFVNVFINYIFIFGKFGAPALGIVGAAIGTVVARITEFIIMLFYILRVDKKIRYRVSMLLTWDRPLFHDLVYYGIPVMLNEFFWAIGTSIHSVILGHMGAYIVAANSICNVVYQIATSFIMGISNASAVIIGKACGTGDIPYAKDCVKKLLGVYLILGFLTALLLILVKNPIIAVYDIEAHTKELANQLMYAYAIVVFFMAFTCPLTMGIFRGSGSTKFAMLNDLGCLWSALPIGAAAAFLFHMPPLVVFSCLKLEMPIKAVICLYYLRGNTWIKNVTRTA